MALPFASISSLSNAWSVLMLFTIPIGGGIPAGVLLAKSKNLPWTEMEILYFISDILLALVFEPMMLLVIEASKRSPALARMSEAIRRSTAKTIARYGTHLGPLTLILIAFGVDPMTGRAATKAAGHGFITGWTLAIIGDMFYFTMLMASTLWLHNVLGNGTVTTIVILVVMMVVPAWIRRIREGRGKVAIPPQAG